MCLLNLTDRRPAGDYGALDTTESLARTDYLCMLPYAVVILRGDPSLFPDVRQGAFVA